MSAGGQFKALYDFSGSGEGVLTFKKGDQFTLVSKTSADWWMVRSPSGEKGLVPVNYVGACEVRPEGAVTKSAVYTTLYDYTAQNDSQLSFKHGETLYLVDKTDVSWWMMRGHSGKEGLVPVNYIDKLDTAQEQKATDLLDGHTAPQANGGIDDSGALAEVLKSIDSNIQRLHEAAAAQGGFYTTDQRNTLETLVSHRQTVVGSSSSPSHLHTNSLTAVTNHTPESQQQQRHHTISSSSISGRSNGRSTSSTSNLSTQAAPSTSPIKSSSANSSPRLARRTQSTSIGSNSSATTSSPRPRRHAPPPPMGVAPANGALLSRKNKAKSMKDNRYSLQIEPSDLREHHQGQSMTTFGSLPRRHGHAAPAPPTRRESNPDGASSSSKPPLHPSVSLGGSTASLQEAKQAGYSSFMTPPHQIGSSATLQPSSSVPTRRYSSDAAVTDAMAVSSSPEIRRLSTGEKVSSTMPPQKQQTAAIVANSPPRASSSRSSNSPASPRKIRSRSTSKERELAAAQAISTATSAAVPAPVIKIELPTNFSNSDGMELVEAVRKRTGVSHRKSLIAINEVLEFLKGRVPACGEMVDTLLSAVQQTQQDQLSPSSVRKMEKSSDVERLKEIFFEITECKDDSQQRGWAVHDDQQAIVEILEELLQILCDANPDATKLVVQEDKYENVLTLIVYYQMESRVPIRLLLLKVFGMLCGLDSTVIGVLLTSVLPNELGRDIQQGLKDIQKTLYSSTVCTMIFSTAEAVPLPVYDQWDEEYVLFLLDCIESPPEEDEEDQVPDAFLNMILSFNQHFTDPSTNLVMKALRQRPNPRNFSEKLMFIINRGEDPVAIAEPCCPDSMTKFLLDVFHDTSTSSMFYTTDMMVLIDIVARQLTDLSQGDEVRTHNLELLRRIVGSTPYSEHKHRQSALTACLNRIAHEEGSEGTKDLDLVKEIWSSYPGLFEEVTDL